MAGSGRENADAALLAALAAGRTSGQAASIAGVGVRTVTRRLADPAFQQRLAHYRAELVDQTAAGLTSAGLAAVNTLVHLLNADAESVRLGAARSILELGRKARESAEIEERLAALEAEVQARRSARGRN